jgi:hypothetical protein
VRGAMTSMLFLGAALVAALSTAGFLEEGFKAA